MFSRKIKGYIPVFLIGKIALAAIIPALSLLSGASVTASATGSLIPQLQYLDSVNTSFDSAGCQVEEVVVSGRLLEPEVAAISVSEPDVAAGLNILPGVPDFDWSYGCASTSAAMLFGYYDRTGYSNMYAGPTGGGLCPMDNSIWGETVYGGVTSNECPLSATHLGVDGRTVIGHVDDYWIDFENAGPDPYVTNGWIEHAPGDCTGDFMGTNQSLYGNTDGATLFFFNTDGSALYDYAGAPQRDGCHGMRLFAESRGYSVVSNFSQKILGQGKNPGLGFTFEDFQAEIDAGRPVLIHVKSLDTVNTTYHVMLGYGYNKTGSLVYLHDTFNYGTQAMTWGSTYLDMQHYGVTGIRLAPLTPPSVTTGAATGISDWAVLNGSLDSLGGYSIVDVSFEWGTVSGSLDRKTAAQLMTSTGIFSATLGRLTPNTVYYFRARATGDISVYGAELSFTYDNVKPTATLIDVDDTVSALEVITGTAYDTFPGALEKVEVMLQNITDSKYWDGDSWEDDQTWFDATGTDSWSYALPALTDGKLYQVVVRSIDMAGNESVEAADKFIFDTSGPSAAINSLDDFVNVLDLVSGTASDIPPGEIYKVEVMLENTADGKYWDGDSWEDNQTWLDATGTVSWSYALPALTDGKSYRVIVRSIDMAGNESTVATDNFTFDTSDPSVAINVLDDFVNVLDLVSGTASDISPGEIHKVEVLLNNITDDVFWNGSKWVSAETWLDAYGTVSWSYTLPALSYGRVYEVKARSVDMAGNWSTEVNDTFTYDTANPSATITDIDDFVNVLDIVTGNADDMLPGALKKVRVMLKNTTDGTYWNGSKWVSTETWLDASGTASWSYALPDLTDGKVYEIKAISVDMAGNESVTYGDAFTYGTDKGGHIVNNWLIVAVIAVGMAGIGLVFLFRFVRQKNSRAITILPDSEDGSEDAESRWR